MIYKRVLAEQFIGDIMNCPECGTRMIKNGKRTLKMRGIVQNFCARGVASSQLTAILRE